MNNLSTFLVRLLTVTATWSTSQQKSVSKLALFFHTSAAAYCTHFSLLKNVTCNSKPMDNIDKQNSTNKNWGIHTIFWHSNILVDSLIFLFGFDVWGFFLLELKSRECLCTCCKTMVWKDYWAYKIFIRMKIKKNYFQISVHVDDKLFSILF